MLREAKEGKCVKGNSVLVVATKNNNRRNCKENKPNSYVGLGWCAGLFLSFTTGDVRV